MLNVGIIGANGFLGSRIKIALKDKKINIYPIRFRVDKSNDISIDEINNTLKSLKLNVIINCSALIGFENCYLNQWNAFNINSILPLKLALIAQDHNSKFIQVSTEAVFSNGKLFCFMIKYKVFYVKTLYPSKDWCQLRCSLVVVLW